jgi:hypothetical protein
MTGVDFGPMRQPQANMPYEMEVELGTALHKIGLNITDEYLSPEYLAQIKEAEDYPILGKDPATWGPNNQPDDQSEDEPMVGGDPATWGPGNQPIYGNDTNTWSPKTDQILENSIHGSHEANDEHAKTLFLMAFIFLMLFFFVGAAFLGVE